MKRAVLKYLILNYPPLLLNNMERALEEFGAMQAKVGLVGEILEDDRSIMEEKDFDLFFIHLDFLRWQDKKYETPIEYLLAIWRNHPGKRTMISVTGGTVYNFRETYTRIHPECMMEITDCTPTVLTHALTHLVHSEAYYSKSILELFQQFIKANEYLDASDYAILYEISLGTPIKELPKKIFLSLTTIYKRRKMLKAYFDVDEQSDRELILRARQLGYI